LALFDRSIRQQSQDPLAIRACAKVGGMEAVVCPRFQDDASMRADTP
jgi:hypothetical protein